jgi:hypothetical protein
VPQACIAGVACSWLMCKESGLWDRSYRRTAVAATGGLHLPAQHGRMDIRVVMRTGLAATLLAAGGAFAQNSTPTVMNDLTLPPAEDRDSLGAIVLENSMVRAQREVFAARHTSLRVSSVGRGTIRASRSARTKEDLQQQREDESIRLHEMGAGALTPP